MSRWKVRRLDLSVRHLGLKENKNRERCFRSVGLSYSSRCLGLKTGCLSCRREVSISEQDVSIFVDSFAWILYLGLESFSMSLGLDSFMKYLY